MSQPGGGAQPLVLPLNTKAPKNGYAYIYLGNENDDAVYFDNFTVSDTRGRIIEEDHYYAYGLKIAAISSKKLPDPNEGSIDNKNLYNDKELFDDADLDWYDYGYRNYDPQIGRFTQLDPLTNDYPELTPYQYASDEPIANVDMDGLEKCPVNVAGDVIKAGSSAIGHAALMGTIELIKISSSNVQDNTFIKNPIRILQTNANNDLPVIDRQQATVGPDKFPIRSEAQKAYIKMTYALVEKKELRERREKGGGYKLPLYGDLFKTINRLGHGDFGGSAESGLLFGVNVLTIPAGGEGAVVETGFKTLSELGLKDGMEISSTKALESAEQFLGKGYREIVPGSGRYVSQDGTRVFRMGKSDITGAHGGGPHVNFETLAPNPAKPGKMMRVDNLHIYLKN